MGEQSATAVLNTPCRWWRFIEEEYLGVSIPRIAIVQNKKLGIVLRVLQISMLIYVLSWGFHDDEWSAHYEPSPYHHSLWAQAPASNSVHNQASRPCQNPWSYWQNSSSLLHIRPTSCKAPAEGVVHDRGFTPTLFVPTFVRSEFSSNSTLLGGSEQYLTDNPEQQRIILFHGFQVQHDDGHMMQGSSASSYITVGMLDGTRKRDGQLRTVLQDSNGDPCDVGGRSEWTPQESQSGIAGTLGDWLACAGITLDTDPRSLTPTMDLQNLAPHLRTMGFTMQFDLNYQYYGSLFTSNTVVCFVRIRIIPNWRLRTWTDVSLVSSKMGMADGMKFEHVKRSSTGVLVAIHTGGDFRSFDLAKALKFLVSCTVLLQMPGFFVRFIALFGMGFTSQMYRRARRIRLNIYRDFHGAIARILCAQMTYSALVGCTPQPAETEEGQINCRKPRHILTVSTVMEKLRIIFQPFIRNGDMDAADFEHMVQLLYRHLDTDNNGQITCPEFVDSCIMQDTIQVQDAVHFFGNERKVALLQRLLDTSVTQRRQSVARLDSLDSDRNDCKVDPDSDSGSWPWTPRQPDGSPALPSGGSIQGADVVAVSPTFACDRSSPADAEAFARIPCDQQKQQQQQQQQDERLFSRVLAAERGQAELSSRVERLERERLMADIGGQLAQVPAEQLDNINMQFTHMRDDIAEIQEHLHDGASTLPLGHLPTPAAAVVTAINDARLLCTQMCELVKCLEQRCAALEETFRLEGGVARPLSGSAWSSKNNKLKEELSQRTQARFKEHLVESLARVGMSVVRLTPRSPRQQQHQQPQQPQQEPSPHPPEAQSISPRAMTRRSLPSCTTTP